MKLIYIDKEFAHYADNLVLLRLISDEEWNRLPDEFKVYLGEIAGKHSDEEVCISKAKDIKILADEDALCEAFNRMCAAANCEGIGTRDVIAEWFEQEDERE